MAAKKKAKNKQKKPKRSAGSKMRSMKKPAKKNLTKKRAAPKKAAQKKSAPKRKTVALRAISTNTASPPKKRARGKNPAVDAVALPSRLPGPDSAGQSGDLQGLSDIETADSESVDELIEEGNAFEAGIVEGVEDAGNADEGEVHTHEVPEDDVPEEYLDKD
jgi:hypothetical protein